eukprot:scaffold666979_cov55-Attheya_sp.AAC.3
MSYPLSGNNSTYEHSAVTDTRGVKTTNIQNTTDRHTIMTIMTITNRIASSVIASSVIASNASVLSVIASTETEIGMTETDLTLNEHEKENIVAILPEHDMRWIITIHQNVVAQGCPVVIHIMTEQKVEETWKVRSRAVPGIIRLKSEDSKDQKSFILNEV